MNLPLSNTIGHQRSTGEDDDHMRYISTKCILSCNGRNHDISNLISTKEYHQYNRDSLLFPKAQNNAYAYGARPTKLTTSTSWCPGYSLYPNKRAVEDSITMLDGCCEDGEAPPTLREWMSDSDYHYPNTRVSHHQPLHMAEQDQHHQEHEDCSSKAPIGEISYYDESNNNPAHDQYEEDDVTVDAPLSFLYQLQQEQEQQRQAQQLVLLEEEQEQEEAEELLDDDEEELLDDDSEHPLLEIAPGLRVPYIGTAARTRTLIHDSAVAEQEQEAEEGKTIQLVCFSCQACLVCMVGVKYMACVACHTVSPLPPTTTTAKQRGAGIGLLIEEAELIKRRAQLGA